MSTEIKNILDNVDQEVQEVLDQKHKCEGLYAEIMINKKKLEAMADVYNKELAKYKKMIAQWKEDLVKISIQGCFGGPFLYLYSSLHHFF